MIETVALIFLAIVLPFVAPDYKTQLSFLWIFALFALTWDLQGGQMGYHTFGKQVQTPEPFWVE
ncbi:MAG: hypothetical protein ACNYPH_07850 [Gammaproteobacteria bacterium WSBS_2016_MAG_OTU1]